MSYLANYFENRNAYVESVLVIKKSVLFHYNSRFKHFSLR
jgi:hypothetical protein